MKEINPLMIGGLKKYRGIEASEVARVMISQSLHADNGTKILNPSAVPSPIS